MRIAEQQQLGRQTLLPSFTCSGPMVVLSMASAVAFAELDSTFIFAWVPEA